MGDEVVGHAVHVRSNDGREAENRPRRGGLPVVGASGEAASLTARRGDQVLACRGLHRRDTRRVSPCAGLFRSATTRAWCDIGSWPLRVPQGYFDPAYRPAGGARERGRLQRSNE